MSSPNLLSLEKQFNIEMASVLVNKDLDRRATHPGFTLSSSHATIIIVTFVLPYASRIVDNKRRFIRSFTSSPSWFVSPRLWVTLFEGKIRSADNFEQERGYIGCDPRSAPQFAVSKYSDIDVPFAYIPDSSKHTVSSGSEYSHLPFAVGSSDPPPLSTPFLGFFRKN